MTRVIPLDRILAALPGIDLVPAIAQGFVALSEGRVEVPPVGELLFPEAHGEMHVKYGAVRGDTVFVVKIATGFFGNPRLDLPPFGGCMIVLSQTTGMVEAGSAQGRAATSQVLTKDGLECAGRISGMADL